MHTIFHHPYGRDMADNQRASGQTLKFYWQAADSVYCLIFKSGLNIYFYDFMQMCIWLQLSRVPHTQDGAGSEVPGPLPRHATRGQTNRSV